MISYELAKELKEVGFPQKGNGEKRYFIDGKRIRNEFALEGEMYYFPTLSELIEACGEELKGLVRGESYGVGKDWGAYTVLVGDQFGLNSPDAEGSSPEEAVARLYIALHKK